MSMRIFELIFRHKAWLMTPVIALSALGIFWGVSTQKEVYTSGTSIWVDRPSDYNNLGGTDYNPYNSPAQNQSNAMRELMSTRSFLSSVVRRMDSRAVPSEFLLNEIRTHTTISPMGNHLMSVTYTAASPEMAAGFLQALLDSFQEYYATQLRSRATQASEFYRTQLDVAKSAYDNATVELQTYLSARPQLQQPDVANQPASATTDVELARLQQTQLSAKDHYDQILDRYAQSQIASLTADDASSAFAILDRPEVPTAPTPLTRRDMAMKPVLGFVLGSGIAVTLLVLLWRADQRVWVPSDLSMIAANAPLVMLPSLSARGDRWPKTFVRLAAAIDCGLREVRRRPAITTKNTSLEGQA